MCQAVPSSGSIDHNVGVGPQWKGLQISGMLLAFSKLMPSSVAHQLAFKVALPLPLVCSFLVACGQSVDDRSTTLPSASADASSAQDPTSEPEPSTQTLHVEHYRAPCMGPFVRSCYLTDDGLFYGGIEGFDYQWGLSYTLEVNVFEVKDPPADGSSLRYELARVLKTEPPADPTFDVIVFDASIIHAGSYFSLFDEKNITCENEEMCTSLREKLDILSAAEDPLTACFTLTLQDGALPEDPLLLTDIQQGARGWGCH